MDYYNVIFIFSLIVDLLPISKSNKLNNAKADKPDSNHLINMLRGSWNRRNGESDAQEPHLGYEPYWYNLSTISAVKSSCGDYCSEMMKRYGPICARNRFFNYKTFGNSCEMVAENCGRTIGWVITRKGECYPYWGTEKWDLWINKGTLSPTHQEEYDKQSTMKFSGEVKAPEVYYDEFLYLYRD